MVAKIILFYSNKTEKTEDAKAVSEVFYKHFISQHSDF